MKTRLKTRKTEIIVEENKVDVNGLVIEFIGDTTTVNCYKNLADVLRKITEFQFGNRGYNTRDSREIRRLALDALCNVGHKEKI